MSINANMDKFRQEHEKIQERRKFKFTDSFEIQDGENRFRLLPRSTKIFSDEGDYQFAWRFLVHFKLFKTKGYGALTCPRTYNQVCPLCDLREQLDDDEVRKMLKPAEVFMMNVLDLQDNKLKRLQAGPQIYDGLAKYWMDPDSGPNHLLSFKEGLVLKIVKTPKNVSDTGWAKYDVLIAPKQVDVTPFLGEGWEDTLNSLEHAYPDCKTKEELFTLVELFQANKEPDVAVTDEARQTEAVADAVAKRAASVASAPKMERPVLGTAPIVQASVPVAATVSVTTTEQAGSGQASSVGQGVVVTAPSDKPKCFGEGYSPRKPECKECAFFIPCKRAFLAAS